MTGEIPRYTRKLSHIAEGNAVFQVGKNFDCISITFQMITLFKRFDYGSIYLGQLVTGRGYELVVRLFRKKLSQILILCSLRYFVAVIFSQNFIPCEDLFEGYIQVHSHRNLSSRLCPANRICT
jgi:hypothetical protein